MYLRSLTLVGFKTFASRTEIRFEDGVTAIVGPNGSGKTNIVDAFRWVLGESQARDLRGTKMQEVIFSGGLRRGAASHAEVSLVVDNSEGRLPVDYREVEIRRRVDRTGQSDYFLNGSRVRRRDVLDLLAATGLAVDAYSIITQSDIDLIVTCSAEQRRGLIEEAARIRGIKAKRSEAAERLRQLAQNMLRLEDVRREIEPRLEIVRIQAEAARQAREAEKRLQLLRGSLAWEEWREARDTHRRASATVQSLERRVAEAAEQAAVAEAEFRRGRDALQKAQDRRLQHQRTLSDLRLEVARTEHELALAAERRLNGEAAAESAAGELAELSQQREAASSLELQLAAQLQEAEAGIGGLGAPPPAPSVPDAESIRAARRQAEALRRSASSALSTVSGIASRREVLEQSIARLRPSVDAAEAARPELARQVEHLRRAAADASSAAARVVKLRAELAGLASIASPGGELPSLRSIFEAQPGFEVALSAALGPLGDALVAPSEGAAAEAAAGAGRQTTILYPRHAPEPLAGSLYHKVSFREEHDLIARRFLGQVLVEADAPATVTKSGVYRHPGLARAGEDHRAKMAVRRRELESEVASLAPSAAREQELRDALAAAERKLHEVERAAGERQRLEETTRQLEVALREEAAQRERLREAEAALETAEAHAASLSDAFEQAQSVIAEHAAAVQRIELERERWTHRIAELRRQLSAARGDLERIASALSARARRRDEAAAAAARHTEEGRGLSEALTALRARLEAVEDEGDSAEEASSLGRALVALEEARVDSRLRLTTLEGNLNLLRREAELAAARMEQLRTEMPEGLAPEEVPGGKAREREMRALEKALGELGPTNPLAEQEFSELEQRFSSLLEQLDDLQAARADLEELIGRLQEQEESRYDAVFGAVASHFQEYFAELSAGGRATLRNVRDDDGRPGLEIIVQPPRKKLQTVSLLSSGERALTALSLMLALQQVNPSPFVILDEVDAALDDANVERFGNALERLGVERQFLVVTHNHATMARAGALYGIHLDESGTSHVVSARLADVGSHPDAEVPAQHVSASA